MNLSKPSPLLTTALLLSFFTMGRAQVVINSTDVEPSAALKVVSSNHGVLIPRIGLINNTDVTTIINPAVSLLIYNKTSNSNLSPGYYYWNGNLWERLFDDEVVYERVAYENTNISTNINGNLDLPIFGNLLINESPQLYTILSNTRIQITKNGRYEIDLNLHLKSAVNGAEPRLRIEVNGNPRGAIGTSGHISTNAGHRNSSIHLFETFNLSAGDVLSIRMRRVRSGNTTFANVGSSEITITKIQ